MSTISTIDKDFEVIAAKSSYTKITPGKHRLRILGNSVSGWVWWLDTPEGGRTPKRVKDDAKLPVDEAYEAKKFLAFPVWNYEQNKIQVWEVTQTTIQRELKALDSDPEWGDLSNYDIEVERTGNDQNTTRYRVSPKPKTPLSPEAGKEVDLGLPALEALYVGADPFQFNPNAVKEDVSADDLPF